MSLVLKLAAAGLIALALCAVEIALENGRFVVRDYPQGARFSVYVGNSSTPVLGASSTSAGHFSWTPRYPLTEGLTYRAVLGGTPPVTRSFTIPRSPREPARLLAIYPTANQLPENMLKMYLHFSAPMSRGEAYRRVRILDAQGRPVELAILEIEPELWDRSGTRLTILFDPGRIKRDLLPNKEVGPPLQAGRAYELAIDAAWPDANGLPLAVPASKKFTVGPADRQPPQPWSWQLSWQTSVLREGNRSPLTIGFPEPMDRALLEQLLTVLDPTGIPVPGTASFENEERTWSFTPDAPWTSGGYTLVYDTALEDLAGNRIGRHFDVDLFETVEHHVKREFHRIPIDVRP